MTPIILLEQLSEFIQAETKDIILPVRIVKNKKLPDDSSDDAPDEQITARAAEVHLMRLPDKDAEINRIPYVVLQYLTGKDEHTSSVGEDSSCNVRIIVATYSKNDSEGSLDVLNVLTRIRIALLRAGVIGSQFLLKKPLEILVYPDDTQPYFFGELMTVWEMPLIQREVIFNHG